MKKLLLLCLTIFSLTSFAVLPTKGEFVATQCSETIDNSGDVMIDMICLGSVYQGGPQENLPAITLTTAQIGGLRTKIYLIDSVGEPRRTSDRPSLFAFPIETHLKSNPEITLSFRIAMSSEEFLVEEPVKHLISPNFNEMGEESLAAWDFYLVVNIL